MNSQESKTALQALRNTFVSEAQGAQAKVDALDVAQKLLDDGYTIDQERIDTDVQKAKDEVATQVSELEVDKEELEKQVAELLTQIDELKPKEEDAVINP